MSQKFSMDDYVDVAARLAELRDKHPEASLQPVDPRNPYEIVTVGEQFFIVYTAACYRHPKDNRPGIGVAWEQYPGRTPYTKNSELQNAETSAWGRAIVAALAADTKRGIATADEVRNRRAEDDQQEPPKDWREARARTPVRSGGPAATEPQKKKLAALLRGRGGEVPVEVEEAGFCPLIIEELSKSQASKVIDLFQSAPAPPPNERRSSMRDKVPDESPSGSKGGASDTAVAAPEQADPPSDGDTPRSSSGGSAAPTSGAGK